MHCDPRRCTHTAPARSPPAGELSSLPQPLHAALEADKLEPERVQAWLQWCAAASRLVLN
jgi:hypothetical protein